ncbi:MAG TPA: hypothetical protein V6C97_33700 [Oculatellaceae cyanobacterium]
MGAFGTAIFDDDDAADVKDEYKYVLADEGSDEKATDAVVESYGADFNNLETTTAFWLGLALTQWNMGRLDERVKQAALRIIDDGVDLKKWTEEKDRNKRRKVLEQTRKKLVSEPPPAKPIPKPLPVQLRELKSGEVIGLRASNGLLILLHVVDFSLWSSFRVKAPRVSMLHWLSSEFPTQEELDSLVYINWCPSMAGAPYPYQNQHLYSLARDKKDALKLEQFIRPGLFKVVTKDELTSVTRGLGDSLEATFATVLRYFWDDKSTPAIRPRGGVTRIPAERAEFVKSIVAKGLKYPDNAGGINWRKIMGFEPDDSGDAYYMQARYFQRAIKEAGITLEEIEGAIAAEAAIISDSE